MRLPLLFTLVFADLVAPAALTAQDSAAPASVIVGDARAPSADERIAAWMQAPVRQQDATWRRIFTVADRVASPGLLIAVPLAWGVGRLAGSPETARLGLRTGEAMVIGSVVTGALKMAFGRARPYASSRSDDWQLGRGFQGSAWQSFPSGHTTVAFAAATGLTLAVAERDRGAAVAVAVGLVSLATATTMGVARMYLNAHWATDVMAGAAVGTLAGVATMAIHRTASGARIDRAFLGMHVDPRGITPLLGLLP